jgi:hypothetical protein
MMKLSAVVGFIAAAAISSFACSSSTGSGNSPGGASSTEVSECKSGCDQAKFFNCSTTADLSTCYDDCNSASPAAIDKFNGCSNTSICDPTCRSLIDPAPASGGTTPTGGGVAASDCQTACAKLITTCNLAPVGEMNDCISQCQSSGYQYQIDCVNNNQCSDIVSRCGSTGGGSTTVDAGPGTDPNVFECQSNCQTLHGESCLTSDEFTTCTNDCSSITGAPLTTFNSCVETANGSDCTAGHDCFTTFTN